MWELDNTDINAPGAVILIQDDNEGLKETKETSCPYVKDPTSARRKSVLALVAYFKNEKYEYVLLSCAKFAAYYDFSSLW